MSSKNSTPVDNRTPIDEAMRFELATAQTMRNWAHLERSLLFCFQTLAQIHDQFRARIILASLPNIQARRRLMTRFANNYLNDDDIRRFNILMKRMSRLGAKRNMLAHSSCGYVAGKKKVEFLHYDDDGEDGTFLFFEIQVHELKNVEQWPAAIHKLMSDVMLFTADVAERVFPSPKMHRNPPK